MNTNQIEIREVKTDRELKAFIRFPFSLYRSHPCWIPPLERAELATLRPAENPAFEHSEAQLFTAWKNGKMAGRIAALLNHLEEEHTGERHARFGWIDFEDDPAVSGALIAAAEQWAKSKQAILLKGPYGFNQLDKNGMLTEGFDSLGTMGTIYNFPYYPQHLERLGYAKDLEWVEVKITMPKALPERIQKFVGMVKERYQLKVLENRSKKDLIKAVAFLFDLMKDTYKTLPGFVPITDKARDVYLKRYATFIRSDFISVMTDANDVPVGFGVAMPSLSRAMQKAGGKLFPFGIFHLLHARRKSEIVDLALIGVEEEWRKRGVHVLVFQQIGQAFMNAGVKLVQVNPMLEFNTHVLQLWKDYDHEIYKRRKTFKKAII